MAEKIVDTGLREKVCLGLGVKPGGHNRVADAVHAICVAPWWALVKAEGSTGWTRDTVRKAEQEAKKIRESIETELYKAVGCNSRSSKQRLRGVGRARAEFFVFKLLTDNGVEAGKLGVNKDDIRAFGNRQPGGTWGKLLSQLERWRRGEKQKGQHARNWALFVNITRRARGLPGGRDTNHTHGPVPMPQMRSGEWLFQMKDIRKADTSGWFKCGCGCKCDYKISMPDADDIVLRKRQEGPDGSLVIVHYFRMYAVDGFESWSVPNLRNVDEAKVSAVLGLYRPELLELIDQNVKQYLELAAPILGYETEANRERDWKQVTCVREEAQPAAKRQKTTRRGIQTNQTNVFRMRSPEALQRLQMAVRLFGGKEGVVSFLPGLLATMTANGELRREVVIGHSNNTLEPIYRDQNLAAVAAGVIHSNTWKHTLEADRKRYAQAELAPANPQQTLLENYPTAVCTLKDQLVPMVGKRKLLAWLHECDYVVCCLVRIRKPQKNTGSRCGAPMGTCSRMYASVAHSGSK